VAGGGRKIEKGGRERGEEKKERKKESVITLTKPTFRFSVLIPPRGLLHGSRRKGIGEGKKGKKGEAGTSSLTHTSRESLTATCAAPLRATRNKGGG